jgi:hypothetical protein
MGNPRFHWKPEEPEPVKSGLGFIPALAVSALFVGGLAYVVADDLWPAMAAAAGGCAIKGNISLNNGQRIYHLPGQHSYDETKILPQYGERWFCSEAEARAAGWRKAPD